ncbi:MAG: hypothetical protein M1828_002650 [Chrysothrix sp. TS-e1954]|nr:MAG: hypothetical protein M1828_002650 [Chrysothrix sp. TS-e1954]
MSKDTRNVVVLGASFAGQAAAHYALKHTLPALASKDKGSEYKVVLVDPSSHFWFHIAAPRALVNATSVPHEKTFRPITEGFEQYPTERWMFYQAEATALDTTSRTISLRKSPSNHDSTANIPLQLPYYALVIATGISTPTPLTSLRSDYRVSINALDDMQEKLKTAKSVVISGGGPVGVETAGEIAEAANGNPGFFASKPSSIKTTVTLVAGGPKLLPIFTETRAKKAEALLSRVGVDVVYNTKVTRVEMVSDDKTTIHLDNGKTLDADVYIPATGVTPNTSFLPQSLLTEKGYIKADLNTMRVLGAGERVFTLGDCGSYTRGGVLDIFAAAPIVGANLAKDLGAESVSKANGAEKDSNGDKLHKTDIKETQIVPIGSAKGVGAFKGWTIPGMMVSQIKGKDYLVSTIPDTTYGKKYMKP